MDLNYKLAYLAGVIVGDGHLFNGTKSKTDLSKDYRIHIELVDKKYCEFLLKLIKKSIKTKTKVKERRDKRINRKLRNKELYNFMAKVLKIPTGNKSGKVFIPKQILNDKELSRQFLAGLYDTDGGKRGNSIGFTSKSNKLIKQTSKVLNVFKISHFTEKWKNKKYNRYYFGIRIYKRNIDTFLNNFPIKNKVKRECRSGQTG